VWYAHQEAAGVRSRGPRPRRMMGLGLLVSLLLSHPHGASAYPGSIAAPQRSPAESAEGNNTSSAASPDFGRRCFHAVRQGESIDRIAARYGTTRRALITANHLTYPDALRAGQRLTVPGCAPGQRVPAMASPSEAVRDAAAARGDAARIPSRPARDLKSHPERVEFIWPVEGPVVSGFGRRGFWGWHRGVDIKAQPGRSIRAAAGGTVLFSGWQSSYGRVIKIAHANGFSTVYAHNLRNFVKTGDRVEPGTVIAAVGHTGRATTYHLHFEIRRQGVAQNPLLLLVRREPARMLAKSAGR
jgi:murein DD-endopeptidase MepM/ murein hydrolase activator NlpD